jgi:hypothetical protein
VLDVSPSYVVGRVCELVFLGSRPMLWGVSVNWFS